MATPYETICLANNYSGWGDLFNCTDPNSWYSAGLFLCMGFSIMGAGL